MLMGDVCSVSVEMLRKLLLVGILVTVEPGSMMQMATGTTVCAVYLVRQQEGGRRRWDLHGCRLNALNIAAFSFDR